MQPLSVDHIGIAVLDIEASTKRYVSNMGATVLDDHLVESQGVQVRFLSIGDCQYELLQAIDASSPVAKYLAKRGEGVHHIAFAVTDIHQEFNRCKELGLRVLQDQPVRGARNKWIFFIHPKDMGGILTEICQPSHD